MQTKTIFFFEVSDGPRGSKCSWLRQPGTFARFIEAQTAAIANGRHPYRIREEHVPVPAAAKVW
jgi:hypothetical protein